MRRVSAGGREQSANSKAVMIQPSVERRRGCDVDERFDAFNCAAGFRDSDASVDRVLVNRDRPVGMSRDACLDMSLAARRDYLDMSVAAGRARLVGLAMSLADPHDL